MRADARVLDRGETVIDPSTLGLLLLPILLIGLLLGSGGVP